MSQNPRLRECNDPVLEAMARAIVLNLYSGRGGLALSSKAYAEHYWKNHLCEADAARAAFLLATAGRLVDQPEKET